ncbi:Extracellular protein SEL-1 and related proteins [Ceraceosorus bombacis]|uniref:Extracellular protein SEL-1 and related proteins n=1 Tax=Ceraceosorus bombacis TaxID=401625 RepID=A0A0P1B9V0_9BASI|nr:Extracellular protein SEL-1 and related proteins [Ceraceosorus bombacis]
MAHNFHNRFAPSSKDTSPPAPLPAQQSSGTSSTPQASSAFDFDFGEFNSFGQTDHFASFANRGDTGVAGAASTPAAPPSSSAAAYGVVSSGGTGAGAGLGGPPSVTSHTPSDSLNSSHTAQSISASPDVAHLEAAVAQQERQHRQREQPHHKSQPQSDLDRTYSSASIAPQPAPSGLPRPPAMQQQAEPRSSASIYSNPHESLHDAPTSPIQSSQPPAPDFAFPRHPAGRESPPVQGMQGMSINNSSARAPPPAERERPSSFFGMERPTAAINAAGQREALPQPIVPAAAPSYRDGAESTMTGGRPSSFFGVEVPAHALPAGVSHGASTPIDQPSANSQAARIAAYHRGESVKQAQAQADAASNPALASAGVSFDGVSAAGYNGAMSNHSTLAGGTGNGPMPSNAASGRPASIAPTVSTGALLDHSHLRPGQQAALLSHNKTLELYRQNAKKTNDPNLIYELAVFMIDASKSMGSDASSGGSGGGHGEDGAAQGKEESARDELIREAVGLLKKIAERGHADAQYFLADCYANGIGSPKGKQDFDHAYPLFVLAAKHGHADAAYRAGTCYEKGWGCRKDASKAVQFYRKAASQSHPGAMYRLATAQLNGELGLKKSAREGVKWLKRSAESATPEFPHALHELALLHERGIENTVFVDPEYSCELLAQAGEMGYAPSAYKLGVNYEYGRMGCPQDAGLSIHMYNIAAQQNHKEACFALTAWYLVGAPGILPQSDTEAYLWAKKAAEQGLAKAEYAVGYFTEMGIGTVKDPREARAWYRAASEHGDKRATQRMIQLGGNPDAALAGVGAGGGGGPQGPIPLGVSTYAGGQSAPIRHTQPPNAPFPSAVEQSSMSPIQGPGSYPSPLAMREAQTSARAQAYEAQVAAVQAGRSSRQQSMMPPPPITNSSGGDGGAPYRNAAPMQTAHEYQGSPLAGGAYPSYPAPQAAPPAGAAEKKKSWFGKH